MASSSRKFNMAETATGQSGRVRPTRRSRAERSGMFWSRWSKGNHAKRAPAAVDDLERGGDHDGTRWRQPIEVAEAGEPELPRPMHRRVIRKGRREGAGLAGVGADRLDPDAEHVAIDGQEFRRARVETRTVRPVLARIDE